MLGLRWPRRVGGWAGSPGQGQAAAGSGGRAGTPAAHQDGQWPPGQLRRGLLRAARSQPVSAASCPSVPPWGLGAQHGRTAGRGPVTIIAAPRSRDTEEQGPGRAVRGWGPTVWPRVLSARGLLSPSAPARAPGPRDFLSSVLSLSTDGWTAPGEPQWGLGLALRPTGAGRLGGAPPNSQPLRTPVCWDGSVLISPERRGSGSRNQTSFAGSCSGQLIEGAIVATPRRPSGTAPRSQQPAAGAKDACSQKTLEGNPLTSSGAACVRSHPLGLHTLSSGQVGPAAPGPRHPLQPGDPALPSHRSPSSRSRGDVGIHSPLLGSDLSFE